MALIISCLVLVAVLFFAFLATALGHRMLRFLSVELDAKSEHLLLSAAMGFICLEVLLFWAQNFARLRLAVIVVIISIFLAGCTEFRAVTARTAVLVSNALTAPKCELLLSGSVGLILILQGLAATAPVTGSDALHYHFTASSLILASGFHPNFFLSHSFLCGQSHMLVLAGLALGSSRIAMGLLFLGGVFAAFASVCVARTFMSRSWSWVVALIFLLTPVVFWQISLSGAPDLWIAFFATMGVLAIVRSTHFTQNSLAAVTGALAGGVAGAKYTGCIVAAGFAVAYFWSIRSTLRARSKPLLFLASAALAGLWPYLRNLLWTGDPVFPFLTRQLFPNKVNAFTLASYLADTGATQHKTPWFIAKSIFFAGIDPAHLGFWQYFGPLVLVFAPLLILVVPRNVLSCPALIVWIVSAVGISATSGMTRFLLPVFPIAIALVLAGVSRLRFPFARYASLGALGCSVLMGVLGLLVYERPALAVAVGLTPPEEYLRAHAPEYEKVQFVNETLARRISDEFALVFLRHTYYLKIPFLYGDPSASWAVDPAKLQTPGEWREFLKMHHVRWIVRAPDYPQSIAAPLMQLEAQGVLLEIAHRQVVDFQALRIAGNRQQVLVRMFEVRD